MQLNPKLNIYVTKVMIASLERMGAVVHYKRQKEEVKLKRGSKEF